MRGMRVLAVKPPATLRSFSGASDSWFVLAQGGAGRVDAEWWPRFTDRWGAFAHRFAHVSAHVGHSPIHATAVAQRRPACAVYARACTVLGSHG
jgi:hypothetical protein